MLIALLTTAGQNGSGKSTFLKCLAAREVPIPEHIDIHLLSKEASPSELQCVQYVIAEAEKEVAVSDQNLLGFPLREEVDFLTQNWSRRHPVALSLFFPLPHVNFFRCNSVSKQRPSASSSRRMLLTTRF
jgi:energy-coupling factor transporter ATP-binding protein EcfA2